MRSSIDTSEDITTNRHVPKSSLFNSNLQPNPFNYCQSPTNKNTIVDENISIKQKVYKPLPKS